MFYLEMLILNMKNLFTYVLLVFAVITVSCSQKQNNEQNLNNVYRFYCGERKGFKVWIVDGALVREKIFNEFIFGGNDERYPFVPEGEIWIDNSVSVKEFETTLEHEINERNLMAKYGMTYYDAHDSSLSIELTMRNNYKLISEKHESSLPLVSPIDYDSTQEIESLPEKIRLQNVYKKPVGERNGLTVWVVDGYNVRRDIYPDFGFSGNGYAYKFIPENEIWIDGEISCEEMEYSIALELKEYELMSKGMYYDEAFLNAIKITDSLRKSSYSINSSKGLKIPSIFFRDTGTAKEKK